MTNAETTARQTLDAACRAESEAIRAANKAAKALKAATAAKMAAIAELEQITAITDGAPSTTARPAIAGPYKHFSDVALENTIRTLMDSLIRLDGTNDWIQIRRIQAMLKEARLERDTRVATETIFVDAR